MSDEPSPIMQAGLTIQEAAAAQELVEFVLNELSRARTALDDPGGLDDVDLPLATDQAAYAVDCIDRAIATLEGRHAWREPEPRSYIYRGIE